jgi:dihydropteroate synthase
LDISADEALNGTTVVHTIAIKNGASILRVHDVKEAKQALILMEYLQ